MLQTHEENYDKKFRGEIPYYFALKESLNLPTAQVAYQVGLVNIIDTAYKLGLTTKIENTPAISLGASTHYPIEVLQAYSTIANFGRYQKLSFIKKIINSNNEIIYTHNPEFEQKIDVTKTAVLVGMMKETLNSGTAKSTKSLGFTAPAAGKTGTTSNSNDVWFAGFTPHLTTVVWLGFDQNTSTSLTGASGAVPIWSQHMKLMSQKFNSKDFIWPDTTEKKEISSDLVHEKVWLIFAK